MSVTISGAILRWAKLERNEAALDLCGVTASL